MAPWWRKFKRCTEGKKSVKSRYSNYEKGSALSQSALGSLQVSRCHSFSNQARTQDPPPPENDSPSFELGGFSKTLPNSPLSGHGNDPKQQLAPDTWGDLATASVSSDSSVDTHDQHGSQLLSLQASDYESKNVTAVNSPSRHQDNVSIISRRILKDQKKPDILPSEDHIPITERGPFGTQVTKLQIAPRPSFFSVPTVPDSNITSPSRSPVKACDHEQVKSGSGLETPCSDMNLVGSGRFCHLDSDKILGPSAVTDMSFIWPHSSECSPIPSPRVLSPGRGCHIQSGGATPLHPRSARFCTELFVDRQDNVKPESHKLPLPPATASSCPFSSSSSAVKSLTPTRNHGQAEMSTSPVTRWKKGRPIGSGTYGQVYLGFNSDTGEMCAIKEVTLFSDDYRSKESAQQLGQEITLLSRLRHPNIVRYFGSEMVDNKLCIYLEYVSGGSVYKILREYGELGESAIRSYTQQILSGLVYLHSKKTVHRDIKGANILVDPNGRVKLADFGMAKHITGGSCPWSFKGSPYWMAPEVIQNSNRCNLAVDIWSLGCTVIEMATTKPPWSQYEGVAALFKIGNSKEHPPIPDHLSEEGKDFVRQCLQRNPQDRPTAIRLLEHPFIRNAASSERWVQISDPLEPIHSAEKSRGKDSVKTISSLALEGMPTQLSKDSKTGPGSRNPHMSKHISCPVSPIGSPLLQPKSSQPMCKRSLVASYQTASGSTTPHTNGNVTLPVNHLDHSLRYPHDVMGARKPKKSPYSCGNPFYSTGKLEILSGVPEASQINENIASCQCDVEGSKPVPSNYQKPEGFCNRQSILAGRVSQQLLTHHLN